MIDFLLGVPGKLKTISDWLTTYWTAARAAKLDFLTANVAVASTAVSNANYTAGRAALLDGIIQSSVIQSIQTGNEPGSGWGTGGYFGYYKNVTISSVNPAKCLVIIHSADDTMPACSGYMSSNTNLQLERRSSSGAQHLRWTVVEFK